MKSQCFYFFSINYFFGSSSRATDEYHHWTAQLPSPEQLIRNQQAGE